MAHIKLQEGVPGIRGPMVFRPETAGPMRELAEVLLRSPHSLPPGERELIAAFVSARNACVYCHTAHGFSAAQYLGCDPKLVEQVKWDYQNAPIPAKLKALMSLAAKVQQSGKSVTAEDVEQARSLGATDLEIHDTILIAAAFCMFNRYVEGLAPWVPDDEDIYRQMADRVVRLGYTQPGWEKPFPQERQCMEERYANHKD